MEELTTALIVFGLAFVVFVLALVVLLGLKGTCAGRCDESGGPHCDFCPERRAEDALGGGGR